MVGSLVASFLWHLITWLLPAIIVRLLLQVLLIAACVVSASMVTQYLVYAVLTTIMHYKPHRRSDVAYHEMKQTFYQVYWVFLFCFVWGSLLWMYLTERMHLRLWYACVFFTVWQVLQLAMAVCLTSYEEAIKYLKAQTKQYQQNFQRLLADKFPLFAMPTSS